MVSSLAERMDWDPDVLIFRDDEGRRIVPYTATTENYDKDEARGKSGRWESGVQYDKGNRVTSSIDPHEHVQIHDSATGEIYWHGPRHEAEDMLREQSEVEPDNTLRIVPYDQSAHAAQQSLEEVRRRQHDEAAAETQRQEALKTPFGLLPGHRDYVEPPSTLYHATLDPNKIATGGFKSSDELGYQTLGGSSSHLVSFTTKANAEKYAQALDVARKAAQGKFGDADLVKVGQRYGVSEEKMHEILDRTEGAKDKSFSVLQAVSMEGKQFPLFMGTSWPQHLKTAGPPALVSVPSSDVKSIYYNPSEHEWRLGDLSNLKPTLVKNEDPSRFGLLPAPPPPVFAWVDTDGVENFDPEQPRDEGGKWTAAGAGSPIPVDYGGGDEGATPRFKTEIVGALSQINPQFLKDSGASIRIIRGPTPDLLKKGVTISTRAFADGPQIVLIESAMRHLNTDDIAHTIAHEVAHKWEAKYGLSRDDEDYMWAHIGDVSRLSKEGKDKWKYVATHEPEALAEGLAQAVHPHEKTAWGIKTVDFTADFPKSIEFARKKLTEKGIAVRSGQSSSDSRTTNYDPDQPRDKSGEWTAGGGVGQSKLRQEDFKEEGANSTSRVADLAASRVAARWNVHLDDLKILLKEDGYKGNLEDPDLKSIAARLFIHKWSSSSGDPIHVAAIRAVAEEQGRPVGLYQREKEADDWIKSHPAMNRAASSFGKAMYEQTQDWLRKKGIHEVELYRTGTGSDPAASGRLFSSWSTGQGGTRMEGNRKLVKSRIPARDIFSVPSTGFGTLAESEVVVLGNPTRSHEHLHDVESVANYDPSQPRGEHGLWSKDESSSGTGLGSVMDKALQGKDEKFHRAISEVSAGFSKVCRDRIATNLLFASFHKDSEALTVALGRDPSKRLCKGCFTSEGELHLCDNGDMTSPIACHELHHVIDLVPYGSHTYSDKPAWRDLWQKEIVAAPEKMSEHADVSASEGFAEFGRLIHTSGLTRGQVASKFPGCYRFFDSEGLL